MSKKKRVLSKGRLINPSSRFPFTRTLLASAIAANVYADPTGGNIVGGAGSINQSNLTTTVRQNTSSLAIDWNTFNLDSNELVRYIQPNNTSVALNRILDNNASHIHGRIDANGHVVLVNPNGIFFGENASINVGGLMASGLAIDPVDFMNGDYFFAEQQGTQGKVINTGIINAATGGSVSLIGKQVENRGLIMANVGAVNLAAGKEAVVTFDNTGLVGVTVTKAVLQEELGVDPAVLNSGEITAAGGRILLTGSVSQDLFSQAVNTASLEQATSMVVDADGNFTLGGGADVVNTGTLDVSSINSNQNAGQVVMLGENITNSGTIKAEAENARGGDIELHSVDTTALTEESLISTVAVDGGSVKILGNKVGLFDWARVDASGTAVGGEVLIGGDRQGFNNQIRNADFIFLGVDTQVSSNGLNQGHGGTLITFASDTARLYGGLSARGGLNGGDGGFIETSGKVSFDILNVPDISSLFGRGGQWLIDPNNITIDDGSNYVNIETQSPFESTNDGARIDRDFIEAALGQPGETTVIIETTNSGTNGEVGDIIFATSINYDNTGINNTLILNAINDININGFNIRDNNTNGFDSLNIIFNANYDNAGLGSVNITNARIYTNGGNFTATGVDFSSTRGGNSNDHIETNGGNVSLTMSGNISVGAEVYTEGGNFTASGSTFNNDSDIGIIRTSFNAGVDIQSGNVSISTTGNISLGPIDTINNGSGGVVSGFGNLTVSTTGGSIIQSPSSANDPDRILAIAGTSTFSAYNAGPPATYNDINIGVFSNSGSYGNNFLGAVSFTGRDVTLRANNALLLDSSVATGNVIFRSTGSGDITQIGELNITGTATLQAFDDNIILNDINNNFSTVIITHAADVTLRDTNAITLATSNSINNLTVTSNGLIQDQDGGLITVSGATTLTAGASNNIILDNANDFSGTLRIISANNVTLNDSNIITLGDNTGDSTISGTLSVTANGEINNSGALLISGATTLDANGNTITLDAANDFDSTVRVVNNSNVTLNDITGITLGDGIGNFVANTLNVTANGNIIDGGVLQIADAATLGATNNTITLDDAHEFSSTVNIVNASNTLLNDINSIILGDNSNTFNVNGTLDVIANGAGTITQGGGLTVTGLSTLTASGDNITLNNATNNFNRVAITAADSATLRDSDTVFLDTINITGTGATALSVQGATGISQFTGTTITTAVGGNAQFTAGNGQDILLGNSGNNFGGTVNFTASAGNLGNVSITNNAGLALQALDITGNLTAVAEAGAITQNAALVVAGLTSLTAIGNVITLDNSLNNFTNVGVINAQDLTLRNNNNINLAAMTLTGDLAVTAQNAGSITQSGALDIDGTASFTADAGQNILLNNNANDITGAVSFSAASSLLNDVGLTNTAVDLGALAITGDLTVVASTGNIIQSGDLSIDGLTTLTATGNSITLNNAGNDFDRVAIVSAATASLRDTNALVLDTLNISGTTGTTLNVQTDLGISQFAGSTISTANAGNAVFAAGAGQSILLGNSANNFAGGLTFTASTGELQNIEISNGSALDLPTLDISGYLTAVAESGAITQSGNVLVDGVATFSAVGNDITLLNNSNNFATVSIVNARDVSLVDTNSLVLGASTITGAFNVTANNLGDITQSGALTVGGLSTFTAAANTITLTNTNNDFANVSVTDALNVSLLDSNNIDLSSMALSGTLTVVAENNGNITQSGALLVTGSSAFTVNDGQDIVLNHVGNNFSGVVSINAASSGRLNNIGLTNAAPLTLGLVDITGNLTLESTTGAISQSAAWLVDGTTDLTAVSNITLTESGNDFNQVTASAVDASITDSNGIDLNALTLSGNFFVNAGGGDIVQSGSLNVDGSASFNANAGQNIIVSNTNNSIAGAISFMANTGQLNTISITNDSSLSFQTLDITGDLTAQSVGGSIAQSGVIQVDGLAAFTALNTITLDNAANDFATISVAGSNVVLQDLNTIILETSNLSGSLDVTANNGGSILQNNALSIAGAALFTVDAGQDIVLDNAGNTINGAISFAASSGQLNTVSITNSPTLDLQALDISGNLTARSVNASITQSGVVQVDGLATFNAPNAITLDNVANDFASISLAGSNATLQDVNSVILDTVNLSGALDVSANNGGDISLINALTIAGAASFTVDGGQDILLNNAGNSIGGGISFNAVTGQLNSIAITNDISLSLQALDITGNLTARSVNGAITQIGDIQVAGTSTVMALTDVTLNNTANDFSTVSVNAVNASFEDINSINLGTTTVSGNLNVGANNNGDITQTAALNVTGNAAFSVDAGRNISLTHVGNAVVGGISFVANTGQLNNVGFTNAISLDLQSLDITGDLTARSITGAIIQSGVVQVDGLANVTAQTDINLNNASNDFASVNLDAVNADVRDSNSIDLGVVNVSGNLGVIGGGTITQSSALSVDGNASFSVAAGQSIVLDNNANAIDGSISFAALTGQINNISLTNNNDLNLQTLSILGDLNVRSVTGGVNQSGMLVVGGVSTLTALTDINLLNSDNNFNTVNVSGVNALLQDTNSIDIGSVNLSGDFTVNAANGGNITLSNALLVAGNASFTVDGGQDIVLNNPGNVIGGSINLNTNSGVLRHVGITNDVDINLGELTISGDLTLQSVNGGISQSGAIQVGTTSTSTFTALNSIILNNTNNNFDTVSANGVNAEFVDNSSINLGVLNLTGTLQVTANNAGDITQSGGLDVGSTATFTVDAGRDIVLNNNANNLTGAISFVTAPGGRLNNVGLTNAPTVNLQALDITGDLTVESTGGDVIQSGILLVDGVSTMAAANTITLNNAGNDFNQINLTALSANVFDINTLQIGDTTINPSSSANSLQITALGVGGITQTANSRILNNGVGAVTTLAVSAGETITLAGVTNDFTTVVISGAGDVSLADANSIDFNAATLLGDLTVVANGTGNITQSGALMVDGITTLTAGGTVTFNNTANNFTQLNINALSAQIQDNDLITIGDSTITGTAGLTYSLTAGGDITQLAGSTFINNGNGALTRFVATGNSVNVAENNNDFSQLAITAAQTNLQDTNALTLHDIRITGSAASTLSIVAGGPITQASATHIENNAVGAVTTISAPGQVVDLNNTNNDFTQIDLLAQSATIQDSNALIIGNAMLNGNNGLTFAVTAGGDITQASGSAIINNGSGALTTVTTVGNNITLTENNDFNQLSVAASAANLRDTNGVSLHDMSLTGSTGATLNLTAEGTVDQVASTRIINNGAAAITQISALNQSVTLANTGNDFTQLNLSAQRANILDDNNLTLLDILLSGSNSLTFNVVAGGNVGQGVGSSITNNGVGAVTSIFAMGSSVTLNESTNDFSQINLAAQTADIRDSNALVVGDSTLTGSNSTSLRLVSGGDLTQAAGSSIINNATNALTLLMAEGNRVIFGANGNDFSQVSVSAVEATLQDTNNLALHNLTLTGNNAITLSVSAGGDVTQVNTTQIVNNGSNAITTVNAANQAVVLNFAGNDFTQLDITAGTADIRDANSLLLGDIRLTGNNAVTFNVLTSGNIDQVAGTSIINNGAVAITHLQALGNNINVAALNNDFTRLSMTAAEATVADSNSLDLGVVSLLGSGGLNVIAGGNISNNGGALTVTGPTMISAGNGAFVTLDNTNNQFTGALSFTSNGLLANVTLNNTTDTQLQALAVSNNLIIDSSGDISQSGAISVGNLATLSARDSVSGNTKNINLLADNAINTLRVDNVDTITLNNAANSLDIAGVTATGDITIEATGLQINGAVLGSSVSLAGGSGDVIQNNRLVTNLNDITISGGTYRMNSGATTQSNNAITVAVTGAVEVLALDAQTNISLTSQNADIRQNNTITSSQGDIVLTAGTGINMAQGSTSTTAAGNITYTGGGDININLLEANGSDENTSEVSITSSNGQILDTNGGSDNLIARRLVLSANSGIGATDTIEIQTAQLFAENNSGRVQLTNRGDIAVERLQNNGDIRFINNADINLASGSVDANYDLGSLLMQTERGSILGIGGVDFSNADITARDAVFILPVGDFGQPGRPIVLSVQNSVFIQALRSWSPFYQIPGPLSIQDESNLQLNTFDTLLSIGGEQLVEVETLEEIDPAIFTDVRNYGYADVSIRLPQDQLFDDELEEY